MILTKSRCLGVFGLVCWLLFTLVLEDTPARQHRPVARVYVVGVSCPCIYIRRRVLPLGLSVNVVICICACCVGEVCTDVG